MPVLIDLVYLAAALVTAPIWLTRMLRTGRIRTDWAGRFGRTGYLPPAKQARILIHAVSVGEVNAIRLLVEELMRSSEPVQPVIATTTDTGFARAQSLWGDKLPVVRYPFDFSFAVRRFLNAIRPDIVVLTELEVWPSFTSACRRRSIPIVVVNGRLTERSFRRYKRIAPVIRPSFRRIAHAAVQNESYAARFAALGVRPESISVTGTMKWDTAQIADEVCGSEELAKEMGINRRKPLIVAGSTAPDEHELLLRSLPQGVQLLCAPRRPEWFDGAASVLAGCVRRSRVKSAGDAAPSSRAGGATCSEAGLFLLDSIGELRQAYALADIVVVGRSFGDLHGSDMMEPVALGKPTVVGPAVADFQDTMDALLAAGGVVQTTASELASVLRNLLETPCRGATIAENGRRVIRQMQGATRRNVQMILDQLKSPTSRRDDH